MVNLLIDNTNRWVCAVCVLLVQSIFHLVQLELHDKTQVYFCFFNFTMKIKMALFFKFYAKTVFI